MSIAKSRPGIMDRITDLMRRVQSLEQRQASSLSTTPVGGTDVVSFANGIVLGLGETVYLSNGITEPTDLTVTTGESDGMTYLNVAFIPSQHSQAFLTEIEIKKQGDTKGIVVTVGLPGFRFAPVSPGVDYEVRARSLSRTGQKSGWTSTVNITSQDVGAAVDIAPEVVVFAKQGAVEVTAGALRWYADGGYTITSVRVSAGTAPTGASLIVDVNKNGTTIFTTQSNRPTIAVSTNTDLADAVEISSLASGDYITVDIDQIGSTIAGSDLTVQIYLQKVT